MLTDEQAEVGGFEAYGRDRQEMPAGVGLHLAVADQPLDVRRGEEVGRGRHRQDFGALVVHREFHTHAPVILLHVVLEDLPTSCCAAPDPEEAQVVADLMDLADDLVLYFCPRPTVSMIAFGHGNFRGVDAVGTKPEQRRHCEHWWK